jgi:tetratricopeptide (TPR) repeat protein
MASRWYTLVALASGTVWGSMAHAQRTGPSLPPPIPSLGVHWLESIEPAVTNPGGYPANWVDRRFLTSLLRNHDFIRLEQHLDSLKREVARDIRREDHLLDSCRAFAYLITPDSKALDLWEAQYPLSSNMLAARAQFHLERAQTERGTAYIRDTPKARIEGMERLAKAALAFADEALQRDSTHLCAYEVMVNVLQMIGSREEARYILDAALRAHPGSYSIRELYMAGLQPKWGGSYEEMEAFARAAAASRALNPRLANLRGSVAWARAEQLSLDDQYAEALAEYDRALAVAAESRFLEGRARTWFWAKDYVRAVYDVHNALAIRPQDVHLLELHHDALVELAKQSPRAAREAILTRAIEQLSLLMEIDPQHRRAKNLPVLLRYRAICRNPEARCD